MIDIRKEEEEPTQIRWCENTNYNVVRCGDCSITIGRNYLASKKEAELFIKAVQKAVDLGWVK